MNTPSKLRHLVAAVLVGVLVGGGLMATTPAGAQVIQAATNWKKIWKKKLAPRADKRYYKKADADARYQPKGSYETAGSGYTKAESDAKYLATGSSYSKAESDAKYAPAPSVIRGTYLQQVGPNTQLVASDITFGVTFATAPEVHYIQTGGAVPAGCSGTLEAPDAAPGHLCVFESGSGNVSGEQIYNPATVLVGSSTYGASIVGTQSNLAGSSFFRGSWAARPAGPVVTTSFRKLSPGAVNPGARGDTLVP